MWVLPAFEFEWCFRKYSLHFWEQFLIWWGKAVLEAKLWDIPPQALLTAWALTRHFLFGRSLIDVQVLSVWGKPTILKKPHVVQRCIHGSKNCPSPQVGNLSHISLLFDGEHCVLKTCRYAFFSWMDTIPLVEKLLKKD